MKLVNRSILGSFLAHFTLLFGMVFFFVVLLDVLLALDRFVEVARGEVGESAGAGALLLTFLGLVIEYEMPRFFQFYAYLYGLLAVGAAGFTLIRMNRNRELLAILTGGWSLHRVALPILCGTCLLAMVQVLNQELMLPRVAPLLLRDHHQIGMRTPEAYPLSLTPDGDGNLLHAVAFNPQASNGQLQEVTILRRDESGHTTHRITAERATWSPGPGDGTAGGGWLLEGGESVLLDTGESQTQRIRTPVEYFATDMSPDMLTVRRHRAFAGMLSLVEISRSLATEGIENQQSLANLLRRYRWSRFSSILINLLIMGLVLPLFLLRVPANLQRRSFIAAVVAVPVFICATTLMLTELPGVPPVVGVFLPVILLLPLVLAHWSMLRT